MPDGPRMKHGMAIGILCGLAISPLPGNGGGYFRGGVEHAGDVQGFEPKATENIRLVDEKLTVSLGPEEAAVEVRYFMHNETAKRVTVRFGFPVEESLDRDLFGSDKPQVPAGKAPRYCKDYQISAGGKALKATWQEEKKSVRKDAEDPRLKGIAGWLVSELSFTGGEEKPVLIRFRSGYPKNSFHVSSQGEVGAAMFRYRLSTAACWAGTLGSGHIVLKPVGIDPGELKVNKPANRFRKQGESWVWDFENLEPTLADDLVIEAVPPVASHYGGENRVYYSRDEKWYMINMNFKVKASSVLPAEGKLDYGVSNLNDFDVGTAWAEGKPGPGVGEWLELRPEVPKPLMALEFFPGYQKSEELFRANPRPRRLKVVLNDEHAFTVDVPDQMGECRIPIRGYSKPVRLVKLVFEEVWPGAWFEDLSVSDVRMEVKLDKKPKLEPVR
jgi:hypothetical protein